MVLRSHADPLFKRNKRHPTKHSLSLLAVQSNPIQLSRPLCLVSRLKSLAKKHKLKTIAFPAISTGAYGYPTEEAADIALEEGYKALNDFDEIRYVCFSKNDLQIYEKMYEQILPHDG